MHKWAGLAKYPIGLFNSQNIADIEYTGKTVYVFDWNLI